MTIKAGYYKWWLTQHTDAEGYTYYEHHWEEGETSDCTTFSVDNYPRSSVGAGAPTENVQVRRNVEFKASARPSPGDGHYYAHWYEHNWETGTCTRHELTTPDDWIDEVAARVRNASDPPEFWRDSFPLWPAGNQWDPDDPNRYGWEGIWNSNRWNVSCDPLFPDGDYEWKAAAKWGAYWDSATNESKYRYAKDSDSAQFKIKNKVKIRGRVLNKYTLQPIAGVLVKAACAHRLLKEPQTTTDENGWYELEVYPYWSALWLTADGYEGLWLEGLDLWGDHPIGFIIEVPDTLLPRPPTVTAELRLVAPTTGTTVGGTTTIRVEAKTSYVVQVQSVQVTVKEETTLHEAPEADLGAAPRMTTSDPDGFGITTTTYEWDWNTQTTHNVSHRMKAKGAFYVSSTEETIMREDKQWPKVANLVVPEGTANGSPDFFGYDPQSSDAKLRNPEFKFKIVDDGQRHQYYWVIYIKSTPSQQSGWTDDAYLQGTATTPGEVTATWNGRPNNNTGDLLPRNCFSFEVRVWEVANAATFDPNGENPEPPNPVYDEQSLKAPYNLQMSEHTLKLNWEAEPATARVDYTLADAQGKDASAVKVFLLNAQFSVRNSVSGGTQHANPYLDVPLHTFTEEDYNSAEWRAVFTAVDNHCDQHREHLNRRMLAVNAVQQRPEVRLVNIAIGYRMWRDSSQSAESRVAPGSEEMRYPFNGNYAVFRSFVRVRDDEGHLHWYSNDSVSVEQLGWYEWIGYLDEHPSEEVQPLPDAMRSAIVVTWRRLPNVVSLSRDHGSGTARWYNFVDPTGPGSGERGFVFPWTVPGGDEAGTYWWGAKVSWRENGNQMNCLLPTDRVGDNPIRGNANGSESFGNDSAEYTGDARYRWGEVGGHPAGATERRKVWQPSSYWSGRMSVRQTWNDTTFATDDPFFDAAADRAAAMQNQGRFQADLMKWAHSFLRVPYSWGGQTYGGRQSTAIQHYTCSHDTNSDPDYYTACRVDPISSIGASGDSATEGGTQGYGADCSGFVGEVAYRAGLGLGDMAASTMRNTSQAQTIQDWRHVRPGDFMASTGHVVYARGGAVIVNGVLMNVPTIEADPGASPGRVWRRTRTAVQLGAYRPRRWIR